MLETRQDKTEDIRGVDLLTVQLKRDCSLKGEQKPILYGSYTADACWRVRIALEWKGIDYEKQYVDLEKGENLSSQYTKLNPFKKVPCLITKTGKILTQSLAIMEYLEATYPERPMIPKAPFHRAKTWSIAHDIVNEIQPNQITKILKLVDTDPDKRKEIGREVIEESLLGLENKLEELSGTYCVADQISIADFCLVPMVFAVTHQFDIDVKEYPYINKIRNTLMTLPEFKNTHPYNQKDCPVHMKGVVQ